MVLTTPVSIITEDFKNRYGQLNTEYSPTKFWNGMYWGPFGERKYM